MDRSTSEKIRLGIFVIIGTMGLVIGSYLIGSKQNLFGNTFELSAVFNNVSGLQGGNNVRFSGIKVGTVTGIEMMNDTAISVRMIIEEDMLEHIRTNAIASIGSDGLVGSMIVNISPGPDGGRPVQHGDEIATYSRIATEDMLGTLNLTNENAALLTADLLQVTEALVKGKGTIGRLLFDTALAANFSQSIADLSLTSRQASVTIRELDRTMRTLDFDQSAAGVLLSDSISGQRIKHMVNNLDLSSQELERLSRNLGSIVEDASKGQGALSYLSNDTVLVSQLQSTIANIDEGTASFSENMEALKQNFLFRRYFKKKARKEEMSKKE